MRDVLSCTPAANTAREDTIADDEHDDADVRDHEHDEQRNGMSYAIKSRELPSLESDGFEPLREPPVLVSSLVSSAGRGRHFVEFSNDIGRGGGIRARS